MNPKLMAAAFSVAISTHAFAAGAVFTMSDDPTANSVLAFARAEDGTLRLDGTYMTGGQGSGGGEGVLGSQGAISLSPDGRFLIVVDAGSDEVSAFRVAGAHLELTGRAPSGGALPVSVTEHDGLVYVLNAGAAGNISGLRLDDDGALHPLAGSTRSLSGSGVGPAQISFDASGEFLAVTEKASRSISVYRVDGHARASRPRTFPSAGQTPFGFSFTRRDVLVVSEAAGGSSGQSSVSSYDLEDGALEVVSPTVADGQTAACWLVTTNGGRYAYTANAGSGNLSSYRIDRRGGLTLIEGVAGAIPGGKPLDIALSSGNRFLYALDPNHHGIQGFAVSPDGSLTAMGQLAADLPIHAVGLASR